MTLTLLCLPGDGIEPEITAATRKTVAAELAGRPGLAARPIWAARWAHAPLPTPFAPAYRS
ncbi:hypothetical protein ACOXXX_15120 [Thalassococcus sp. BH17M4-6]|uniref:hypothetical protein n=1 Tax=Thalassococcus sp. BH17M4-6 TaxID=3413148 RepID=UPI003BE4A99C